MRSLLIIQRISLHILTLSEAVMRQHSNHGGKRTKTNHTIWIIASVHKCVSSSTALWRMVRSMCIITSQFRILTTLLNAGQKSGGGGGGNARKSRYANIFIHILPSQQLQQKGEEASTPLSAKQQPDLHN